MGKEFDDEFEKLLRDLASGGKHAGISASASTVSQVRAIVEQFKPEVDSGLDLFDELLEEYGDRIAEYFEKLRKNMVDADIATMKEYKDAGINEEIAYRLIRDRADRMQAGISQNFQKK